MSDKTIIKLENLVFNYDGEPVLDGINLSIHDKEFVTFLGPSGCGKPPLFGLLAVLSIRTVAMFTLTAS